MVTRKDTVELFTKYKVYSEKELTSRFNILSEAYVKAVNIEALTAAMMAKTFILPAALRFQKEIGESVAAAKSAGAASPAGVELLSTIVSSINDLYAQHRAGQSDQPSWRRRCLCPRQAHA